MRALSPLVPAAALLLGFVVASTAPAQGCWPFAKRGMRPVTWGPGSSITLGRVDRGDAAIALRFVHDATFDVALDTIGHRGTASDGTTSVYEFSAAPAPGERTALWRAVFRAVDSETPIEVLPCSPARFRLWADDPRHPQSLVFQWTGACLPDPLSDSLFWMELRADLDPRDPTRVEWQSRMGRVQQWRNPNRYTLDEVEAPIIHVRAPGFGEFTRLLVPIAGGLTVPAANLPMRVWSILGCDVEFEHPARDQQLQFSAVYSGDPASIPMGSEVASSYRKIVYLTTEDADGHYKQFRHCVQTDGLAMVYRWAPTYFPTYGPWGWLNVHSSPYPVVMQALQACTDSFWYDCTSTYREFVDRRMGLTRIADRRYALNPDFPRASAFVANSVAEPIAADPLTLLYSQYTDNARRLQQVFDGADGRTLPTFMEWQKWLKGDPNDSPIPGRIAEDPIGPDFNPAPYTGAPELYKQPPGYVLSEISRARSLGINVSVYTLPLIMDRGDWPTFDDAWLLRQRDGSYYPVTIGATGRVVDFGARGVPWWFARTLYDDVFDTAPDLGGVFFDVLSGGGSFPRYPTDPSQLFRMRQYHGGTAYVEGTQRTFDLVRQRIAAGKRTRRHPDVPFIPSETVQEYSRAGYDFGQHGLKTFPMQMQLARIYDQLAGVPSVSPEAQNPSPPLWNAVYHEWSRAEGLTVMLSTLGVNGPFLGGGQFDPSFPGLTWERWGDYMRFVHALWWFQGSKPTSFQYLSGYEDQNLLVDAPGGGVEVRNPAVPQQQQLVDFLRRLHHALDRFDEAGKFLSTGRMERPLATPFAFDPTRIEQSAGPSSEVAQFTSPTSPGVRHFYENFWSTQPYPVPHVMHAVWRSVETGELGIVFVNWSDQPATWEGTFDPGCYDGFRRGRFEIRGVRPDGARTRTWRVAHGDGPTTLSWGATPSGGIDLVHHDASGPGEMPPRSVQVFVVRPR